MRSKQFLCGNEQEEKSVSMALAKPEITNMKLLDKLEYLINAARGCELKTEFFEQNKELINSVSKDLSLTPTQTVMLCPYVSNPTSSVDGESLRDYFSCSAISIMKHKENLDVLVRRRYITRPRRYRHSRNDAMTLSDKAEKALCDNKGLLVVKVSGLTPEEFMSAFHNLLIENQKLDNIDNEELLLETMDLIKQNPQLKIVQELNKLKVDDDNKLGFLYYCKSFVIDGDGSLPLNSLEDFVFNYYMFSKTIFNGEHPFITMDLLKPVDSDRLMSRDVYMLTDKARKLFLSEYVLPRKKKEILGLTNATLIKYNDIKPKTLFYSAEDQGEIDTLHGLLEDRQLTAIRSRLADANMRKGFNCLFYGEPGTGKTETALQLARLTKRDIMQVDISSMRDKWYGETEKIVKGVFEDYGKLVKRSKRIPILLINEADALLSVRTNLGSNNPTIEKTENSIQNILLESMENLDGILIATTNLTCNLDSAFERRFLYKVEFHKPSIEAKINIWKSFLPDLCDEDAVRLAKGFDFSGGQIENITRKIIVDQLLYGMKPDIEHIETLCSKETLSNNNRRIIGFH